MAKRLILIDLSGIFRANWHATADMELSEAFSRTVSRVHGLASGYDLCAVCCDWPPYRRKAIHEGYKAQRDAPPANMVEQFRRVKERLTDDGFLLWQVEGYEADDLIATACTLAEPDNLDITIASSDKDLLCLVDDGRPIRQVSLATGEVFDEAAVKAKFGVPPAQMVCLLALTGDSADNVPGIPGVGPKKAAKLLADFGTALNVLAHAEEISGKLGEAVLNHRRDVELALRLVTLARNVPLDWDAVYAERKAKPVTKDTDWTDADFTPAPATPATPAAPAPPPSEPKQEPPAPPTPATNGSGNGHAEPKASTALALAPTQPQEWSLALEPNSTRDAWVMAGKLYESRLYPQLASQEAIFAIMLRGRSIGVDATTALSLFHMVEGRPTMHADLVVGLVLRSGKAEFFEIEKLAVDAVTYCTKRRGARKDVSLTWSMEDALRAGLVTKDNQGRYHGVSRSGKPSNWDKYPRAMLRHRAATELARAVYPDVTAGLYTPDEISEGAGPIEAELLDG